MREGEWCLNYPSIDDYGKGFETIHLIFPDNGEITKAWLTVELPKVIQAPRIAESPINVECQLE